MTQAGGDPPRPREPTGNGITPEPPTNGNTPEPTGGVTADPPTSSGNDLVVVPGEASDLPPGVDDVRPAAPARPSTSLTSFTLEGRVAPAVYVAGWVGTLVGGGLLVVSLMAAGAGAAPWIALAGLVVLGGGLIGLAGSQATERARQLELPYRGPSPVLAFLAFVVVTLVVQLLALAPLSAAGLDLQSPLGTTIDLALQTLVYVGIVALLVVGPGALSWREMGVLRPGPGPLRDLALGALVAVPVLIVTLVLSGLLSRFIAQGPSPLPPPGNVSGLLLNLVSGAILAPIGEELFFRGFTTTAWARTFGVVQAIIRGAVLFALIHGLTLSAASFGEGLEHAVFSFVALLPVGLTLGWLFLKRRSLYASVGLHAAFNGIQLVLVALVAGLV